MVTPMEFGWSSLSSYLWADKLVKCHNENLYMLNLFNHTLRGKFTFNQKLILIYWYLSLAFVVISVDFQYWIAQSYSIMVSQIIMKESKA